MELEEFKFNLLDVVELYCDIKNDFEQRRIEFAPTARDPNRILKFLAGVYGQDWEIYSFDFYDTSDYPEEICGLENIVTHCKSLRSFCLIYQDNDSRHCSKVGIAINTAVESSGQEVNNYCWARFCTVKEMCQGVIFQSFLIKSLEIYYPRADSLDTCVELLSDINFYPFSFRDFNDEDYPIFSKIENAAEVLAVLIMSDIDELMKVRKEVLEKTSEKLIKGWSFEDISDKYKIPRRLVDKFISSENVEEFYQLVNARLVMAI